MNSEKLKKLRENKEMSQKEVAIALGMSSERYHHYESGKREPDFQTIKQIATFFNVSVDYLLDHSPPDRADIVDLRGFSNEGKKIILAQVKSVEQLEEAKWGNRTLEKQLKKLSPGHGHS